MKTYRGNPILEIVKGTSAGKETDFGVFRNRYPDRDWAELQQVNMELGNIEEEPLTENLRIKLLGDLAYAFGNNTVKFEQKLKEFNL